MTPFYFGYCLYTLIILSILFAFFSLRNYAHLERLCAYIEQGSLLLESKHVRKTALILFAVGTTGTLLLYSYAGVTAFQQNKVTRLDQLEGFTHYLNYLRGVLSYYLPLGYFILRKSKSLSYRVLHTILLAISIVLLGLQLNRGDYTFFLLFIIYLEFANSIQNREGKSFLIKFTLISTAFISIFNWFGNLRFSYVLEKVYKTDLPSFYGMAGYPSWFVWIYIYLTSPIENFRDILEKQTIEHHSHGLLLLRPFFQIVYKLLGYSLEEFESQVYPILENTSGLNVSSFQEHALIDFSYAGMPIYVIAYCVVYSISLKVSSKNVYGFLTYIMGLNLGLWSLFVNSFANGIFPIGYLLFLFLCLGSRENNSFVSAGNLSQDSYTVHRKISSTRL